MRYILATAALLSAAFAQTGHDLSRRDPGGHDLPRRDLSNLPPYEFEYNVTGAFRIFGSELKGNIALLASAFNKLHPLAKISLSFFTSSEGAIAGLYTHLSDLAPAGDDAKITDMFPFFNAFQYLPTEISIATGGHEKRGTLWPAVIVVHKDNPLVNLTMDQLDRIFGAERSGGWKLGADNLRSSAVNDNILYTSEYARNASTNIRTWSDLGLTGDYQDKEIQTYGYVAPGFKIYWERKLFHWSQKWNPNLKEYVETKEITPDSFGPAVDSTTMLEELSNNPYGIGWAAQLHVKDYPNVKSLAIAKDDMSEAYPMNAQTVSDRLYPLVRDAFIYINKPPDQHLDPKVREFLRFCLSRDGQQIISDADMYYPLTLDELTAQLKKVLR